MIDASDIEIWLAEALAESYARDCETLAEYMPEIADLDENERTELLLVYEDNLIDFALNKIAKREEQTTRPPRPRSPIEMMVDRACGIEVRDDGTIVELESRR